MEKISLLSTSRYILSLIFSQETDYVTPSRRMKPQKLSIKVQCLMERMIIKHSA